MEAREPRRILLVDNHADFRGSLALVLAGERVGECVEAANRREALDRVEQKKPDVALVDLSPHTEDALQPVGDLWGRGIPVLVFSTHEEPSYVRRAFAAGARAYVTKREVPREIVRAVRDVIDGWTMISPRATEGLQ